MNIPIKFKFFDKLKLYQDYLQKGSMLEKTKDNYWLCEKSILFWGYSKDHQYLGVPLGVDIFTKNKRAKRILENAEKIGEDNYRAVRWVMKKKNNRTEMKRILENLITLEFVTKFVSSSKEDSKEVVSETASEQSLEVTLNLKGFLLGELLFETYEEPKFWSRNFRKYKLALLVFYVAFTFLLFTVFFVFIEHLFRLIGLGNFMVICIWFLGCFWWSTVMTCFLIFLLLRQIWKWL